MLKWEELQQRNASARIFRGGCRIYIFTMQVSRHSILPMQNRNCSMADLYGDFYRVGRLWMIWQEQVVYCRIVCIEVAVIAGKLCSRV